MYVLRVTVRSTSNLLPVATLVTNNTLFFFLVSEVTYELSASHAKHSLCFVHNAEGERKAGGNLLKFPLRYEAVLVVVVVLKHGL